MVYYRREIMEPKSEIEFEVSPYSEEFVDLPLRPAGVYLLLLQGVVVYVGQSVSVFSRIVAHRNLMRKSKRAIRLRQDERVIYFDQVRVRFCEPEDLSKLEVLMIDRFNPEYNRRLKRVYKNGSDGERRTSRKRMLVDLTAFGFNHEAWKTRTAYTSSGLLRLL